MAYWVMSKVNGTPEGVSVASAKEAVAQAKRYVARGGEILRIIGPNRLTVPLGELERSLSDRGADPTYLPKGMGMPSETSRTNNA
jgi:hypothetical protein